MIQRVELRYFKRFLADRFELTDSVILAGPNNSGKTTLLQAVAVWHLALQKWLSERDPASGSKAKKRTGVAITRNDFTPIPLQEMSQLWFNRSTSLYKDELQGRTQGTPRKMEIRVTGKRNYDGQDTWTLGLEFTYRHKDYVHVSPAGDTPVEENRETLAGTKVAHIPPFSGIGAEETRYDRAYQDLLIGQGKPGDILRNLLLELSEKRPDNWKLLQRDIEDIFRCSVETPVYEGGPFIRCQYTHLSKPPHGRPAKLDVSSAGSGFLQVLMLLGFFYARPATVLLLDEPDAHLHVILQKQVYDRLREIARKRNCQLLIATHSEVLIDNTSPERILSFVPNPHLLRFETERDQVREALKRLSTLDIVRAEHTPAVLYFESENDLNLLREWARVLEHPAFKHLHEEPFAHYMRTNNPREARSHFFALKSVHPEIRGILLLDGDNRGLPDHEISAEGMTILRWARYEAENYLIHPEVLKRFVASRFPRGDLFEQASVKSAMNYLEDQLPPAVLRIPLDDHDYLQKTGASKKLLPGLFKAAGVSITKREYYQIASQMLEEEVSPEIHQKLDEILSAYPLDSNDGFVSS